MGTGPSNFSLGNILQVVTGLEAGGFHRVMVSARWLARCDAVYGLCRR